MKRDLLSLADLEREEILHIFSLTRRLKEKGEEAKRLSLLRGKVLGLIFHKPSMRTRVSFEVAMVHLGGHAMLLGNSEILLGERESVADVARVLSGYMDGLVIRTFDQALVEEVASCTSIPVINGLTDLLHPCQILAALYTIQERLGRLQGLKVVYVGDGNNVAHSWLLGAAKMGLDLTIACPPEYRPNPQIFSRALNLALTTGSKLMVLDNPLEAVRGAHIIYTDVWASMGQEQEKEERAKAFSPYQVNAALLKAAGEQAYVMHCLPAHRGEEIISEVIDGPRSLVWEEAENRLHVQKAILIWLLGGEKAEKEFA